MDEQTEKLIKIQLILLDSAVIVLLVKDLVWG